MCASFSHQNGTVTDACQGDSGGPLICRAVNDMQNFITGVVSTGSTCGSHNYPGIYVPVAKYWYWIYIIGDKKVTTKLNRKFVCKDLECD